ncbi:ABC transporter permease [uncultured Peptoniphilus sp.]|uniref:ABC transporter permease n=1 Tax=uncultured Peptoniphilus sp. TaxID=254354 RepID=UPI00258A9C48|nr:ABC transporter permease [uncultured Peptoniphilus sp.]MDU6782935.1 ABC transporter permease [Peptoniphilus harei]
MNLRDFAKNNIIRDKETYIGYWLSCTFTVFVFFIFSVNQFHPELNQGPGAVATIMGSSQVIVVLFSIFFLGLSINSFLSRRENMFGVLLMMGMSKKQLRRLIIIENMIIGFSSIIVGILLGLAFGHILVLLMANIINLSSISFYFPMESIVVTFIAFSILFFLIAFFRSQVILKKPIYNLLDVNQNEYGSITYSRFLSITAIILILLGYALANIHTINRLIPKRFDMLNTLQNSDILHVLIGGLVTIGMFLFFTQFSKYFTDKVRRNEEYYLKDTRALWISELMYRLSSNSKTMFISALLLTVAFITTIGTIALNSTADDEVSETTPFDISYFSFQPNEKEEDNIKFITSNLREAGVSFQLNSVPILQKDDQSKDIIISQEDYNSVSNENEKIELTGNEAVTLSNEDSQEKISITDNVTITIVDNRPNIFDSYRYSDIYVVNNELFSQLAQIFEHTQTSFLYHFSDTTTDEQARQVATVNREILGSGRSEGNDFLLIQKIERVDLERYTYQVLTYIGIMLSVIFILAAGSLIYFRLLSNIRGSSPTYTNLYKIGLSINKIQEMQRKQFTILFFAPILFAIVNTIFAVNMLSYLLATSIWEQTILIALVLLVIQVLYYYFMNNRFKAKIELILTQK